jgi:hypothetical protein
VQDLRVKSDAIGKLGKLIEQRCGDIHAVAPKKRIRPLIVSLTCWFGKSPRPMTAADTDHGSRKPRH